MSPTKGEGGILVTADAVGIDVRDGVGVTNSCIHNIS